MPYYIIVVLVLLIGSSGFLFLVTAKKQGWFRSKRRELDLALLGLSQQLRRDPNNPRLHLKRGVIRYRKRDMKGALADLTRALEIDASFVEAHYHRGIVFHEIGDLRRAEKDFDWIQTHSEDPFYKTAVSERLRKIRAAR